VIGRGRMPVVFLPATDERFSSWLARMVPFYAMTVPEFLVELGLPGRDMFDLEWRLSEGEGARISDRTGLSGATLQAMAFREIIPEARMMIARKNCLHCLLCPRDIHRKSAAFPWSFRCPVHGVELRDATGVTLSDMLGAEWMAGLVAPATAGFGVLTAWAQGEGQGAFGAVEILAVLTTRHRRASPPPVSEQPRMSLQTRRDHHAFLTTPITRQALAVVVPEHNRVAPVLAKPVRPGLHGLAQGSLLQGFALTVGIGRVAEDPVNRAIDVLLASDAEGEGRVRDGLKTWPLSLRRRVAAPLWRAQQDESDRQIAQQAARRHQSHKYRRAQSHKYAWRVS
jgi:hypothetical protein